MVSKGKSRKALNRKRLKSLSGASRSLENPNVVYGIAEAISNRDIETLNTYQRQLTPSTQQSGQHKKNSHAYLLSVIIEALEYLQSIEAELEKITSNFGDF